ncbi:hypothetical protein [Microbulbifer variabilis]|uniref:hypothetical protein n=1 Tax=Microbulbifer variabilis TaxID=266805 RepID=UPI001CFCAA25|nr:hypothetical protein [Microbulbifer variabilis]
MTIRSVSECIEEWQEHSWDEIISLITQFRDISKAEYFILDDAESYDSPIAYVALLDEMAELLKDEFSITNISHTTTTSGWVFNFFADGQEESIILNVSSPEWFENNFLSQFNLILQKYDHQNIARMVHTTSVDRIDQCFNICFLSDSQFQALQVSKPAFAFEDE